MNVSFPPPVLLKLGGSLITDKVRPRALRPRRLAHLARQVAAARDLGVTLILGHGSGSFGHPAAAAYGLHEGFTSRQQLPGISRTQTLARELHGLVLGALQRAGAFTFSLPPGAFMVADHGTPQVATLEPLLRALDLGLLPVVFGDVLIDRHQGVAICSTEAIFVALAKELSRAGRQVGGALWLGDTPGILDPEGRTVPVLDPARWDTLRSEIGSARGTDVTGGMVLRAEAALALARMGVESWLLDGRPRGALSQALSGAARVGTRVPASGAQGAVGS